MSIAKLAYLTSPSPNVFIINYQIEGSAVHQIEISRAHLANIIIDGASMSLREQYPTAFQSTTKTENANGHDRRQQPA